MSETVDSIRFRDAENAWYFESPTGDIFLGSPFNDRLTEDEIVVSRAQIKGLTDAWEPLAGPLPVSFSNLTRQRFPIPLQGYRSTCVCFALVAAMEGRLSGDGVAVALSPQYANWVFMSRENPPRSWCEDRLRIVDAAHHLTRQSICREEFCGYEKNTGAWCVGNPSSAAQQEATFGILDYMLIPGTSPGNESGSLGDLDLLQRIICTGYDIAISIAPVFCANVIHDKIHHTPYVAGAPYEVPGNFSGHAVLIVGYATSAGVPYFECKDSFGLSSKYAHNGYVWISADCIARYARYGIVVTKCVAT